MYVAVDEARNRDAAAGVDFAGAAIALAGADDRSPADRDVAHRHFTRGEVENADRLDDQVGRPLAAGLVDDVGETGFGERSLMDFMKAR